MAADPVSYFDTTLVNDRLNVRLLRPGWRAYDEAEGIILRHLEAGIRALLIDKRGYYSTEPYDRAAAYAASVGRAVGMHSAKLAVVLNEADHHEKAICAQAMRYGARVLTTTNVDEAVQWLDGEIN